MTAACPACGVPEPCLQLTSRPDPCRHPWHGQDPWGPSLAAVQAAARGVLVLSLFAAAARAERRATLTIRPDASGHAREACPAMTSAALAEGLPHVCLAATRRPLPGGGYMWTRPEGNPYLPALTGRRPAFLPTEPGTQLAITAEAPRGFRAWLRHLFTHQIRPGWSCRWCPTEPLEYLP